jgi:hypothetical protein
MTKAILIDPLDADEPLKAVEYTDLQAIYDLLGCDCIDAARLEDGHAVYVDDEGSFKANGLFSVRGFPHPLFGKGLLVGPVDNEGETTDCQHTLEWAKQNVGYVVIIHDTAVAFPFPI